MMTFEPNVESARCLEHMGNSRDQRNAPYVTEGCRKHGRYGEHIYLEIRTSDHKDPGQTR